MIYIMREVYPLLSVFITSFNKSINGLIPNRDVDTALRMRSTDRVTGEVVTVTQPGGGNYTSETKNIYKWIQPLCPNLNLGCLDSLKNLPLFARINHWTPQTVVRNSECFCSS